MYPWQMTRKTLVTKDTPEHQEILDYMKDNLAPTKDVQPKTATKVWLVDDVPYDYVTMTEWDYDVGQYRVACYYHRNRTVRYFPNQYEAEQFRLNNPRWETLV